MEKRADQGWRWLSVKDGRERSEEGEEASVSGGEGWGGGDVVVEDEDEEAGDEDEEEEGGDSGSGSRGGGGGDVGDDVVAEGASSVERAASGLLLMLSLGSLGGRGAVENRRVLVRVMVVLQRKHGGGKLLGGRIGAAMPNCN